jgi:hypothetical protein
MLQLEYTLFDRMIMLELNPEMRNSWRRISRKCCPVTGSLKGPLPSPRNIEALSAKFPGILDIVTLPPGFRLLCTS